MRLISTPLIVLTALLLSPACSGRGGSGGAGDDTGPLASEISIEQVSIYQGPGSLLMDHRQCQCQIGEVQSHDTGCSAIYTSET